MKITTKGQVTIPVHIRKFLGITAHSEVDFRIADDKVILIKQEQNDVDGPSRFAKLRGTLKGTLTTDEWMRATRGDE